MIHRQATLLSYGLLPSITSQQYAGIQYLSDFSDVSGKVDILK